MVRIVKTEKTSLAERLSTRMIWQQRYLYLLLLPATAYFIIFCYIPMYGALMAFTDYLPGRSFFASPWVGFKYFEQFFNSYYFFRLIRNTLLLSIYGILCGFPIPILFALMLNEIRNGLFKRTVQTISYLPHFISVAVIVGLMFTMLSPTAIIGHAAEVIAGRPVNFLSDAGWFRTIYTGSGVWQEFGWNSIIYLAALSSISSEQYEAADIDGASRLQKIFHVTIPGIMPTIVILLILCVGNILSVGFEKIILMYSPSTYETADVISTFVYRAGILSNQFSYASAVSLFNSVVNLAVLILVNAFSRKVSDVSLW